MNQVIIYKQDNGTVAIIRPTEDALALIGIDAIAKKDVPAGVSYRIVNDDEVPSDRTFRNAWSDNNGIKVDMPKAKDMTKARLRAERIPLFEAQDVAFQRALEAGTSTALIIAEKNRLRDLPKMVDAMSTLDELKSAKA